MNVKEAHEFGRELMNTMRYNKNVDIRYVEKTGCLVVDVWDDEKTNKLTFCMEPRKV